MARSIQDNQLRNRTNRLKLAPEHEPYWVRVLPGLHLGYFRPANTWWVRALKPGTKAYIKRAIGAADDHADADGKVVLNFYQAQDAAKVWLTELNSPKDEAEKPRPTTVAEAAAHYLEWFKEHRKSYRETKYTVDTHILPALGAKPLSELKTREIKTWHDKLAVTPARKRSGLGQRQQFEERPTTADGKRARKATANRILTVLKAILNKSFEDEFVADDTPWRRVKPFPNADEAITRFLTEAESTRLINASEPDFRLLIKAALFTGARYGELARLRVLDVNLEAEIVAIQPEGKSGRTRYIPLSRTGLSFFKGVIAGKRGDNLVFTRADGKHWGKSHQDRPMLAANQNGAIEPAVRFHELRHTYASHLAQAGVDLLTISKLLGHADTRITSRHYAHLCDRTLSNAVQQLPDFGHVADGKIKAIR